MLTSPPLRTTPWSTVVPSTSQYLLLPRIEYRIVLPAICRNAKKMKYTSSGEPQPAPRCRGPSAWTVVCTYGVVPARSAMTSATIRVACGAEQLTILRETATPADVVSKKEFHPGGRPWGSQRNRALWRRGDTDSLWGGHVGRKAAEHVGGDRRGDVAIYSHTYAKWRARAMRNRDGA